MPNPEDFDDFYLSTRRRLVLQAYALTGDLSAGRQAVREAFVAARHHWRKVGRLPDPEEWVRQRAWAMAQRRHVARLWHREKGITAEQKSVLDTLHRLPDQQRKVLLLTHLAALSNAEIGRELGERPSRVDERLARATTSFCEGTGTEPADLQRALESLAPIAEATALPAPAVIARNGRRRHRLHLVTGTAALLALVVAGGLFVVTEGANDSAGAQPAGRGQAGEGVDADESRAGAGPRSRLRLASGAAPRTTPRAPGSTPSARRRGSPTRGAVAPSCASTSPPALLDGPTSRRSRSPGRTRLRRRRTARRWAGSPAAARPGSSCSVPTACRGSRTRRWSSSCASRTRCAVPTSSASPAPERSPSRPSRRRWAAARWRSTAPSRRSPRP